MNRTAKLVVSIVLDIIGFGSYTLIGELGDIVVAPLTAGWIYYAYGTKKMAVLGFLEEILPFTDFIPSCTIAHFVRR